MKTRNKKGFTIVELVIVIAVIGILTAILVPVFINLTNKANRASDDSLVKNLNTAMAMEEGEGKTNNTYHDAIQYLDNYGYKLANLATKAGNDLLWNSKTNRFLLNEESEYVADKNATGAKDVDYWTIKDNIPVGNTFSIYAGLGWNEANPVVVDGIGFDAGDHTGIETINYTNTGAAKEVVIRTNSASATLSIDAEHDTVTHYGKASKIDITAVDNSHCYNEHGDIAGNINLKKGKVVVHKDCSAGAVVIDMTAAELATVTTLSADNSANKEVPIILNTSEVLWDANPNNGLINPTTNNIVYSSTGGTLPENFDTMTNSQKEAAIATASEELVQGVAAIGNVTYTSLEEAYEAAVANDTIILLKDVSYTNNEVFYLSKPITINGNSKTFTATGSSASYAIYFFNEEEGVANKAEIKNLTVNTTGYQAGILTNDEGLTNANPAKLYLNNVSIYSEGECVYANGHTQIYASNCTLNRAGKWKTKDEVYYSALIIGYGAKIDFRDSTIVSEGTGIATFPSGGTINVYNTTVEASNPNNAYVHSYAIWSRIGNGSTPITEYADAGINIYSGNVIGALNTTDESTIHDSFLIIAGGTFSEDPTAYVDAENYQVKGTSPYIVSAK